MYGSQYLYQLPHDLLRIKSTPCHKAFIGETKSNLHGHWLALKYNHLIYQCKSMSVLGEPALLPHCITYERKTLKTTMNYSGFLFLSNRNPFKYIMFYVLKTISTLWWCLRQEKRILIHYTYKGKEKLLPYNIHLPMSEANWFYSNLITILELKCEPLWAEAHT